MSAEMEIPVPVPSVSRKWYVRRTLPFQDQSESATAAWLRFEGQELTGYLYDRPVHLASQDDVGLILYHYHRPHDRSSIYLDGAGREYVKNRYYHYFIMI